MSSRCAFIASVEYLDGLVKSGGALNGIQSNLDGQWVAAALSNKLVAMVMAGAVPLQVVHAQAVQQHDQVRRGRPQPLAREVSLPAALRAHVNTTLLFEGGATDLGTLAERIQLATGILTQVAPDALLPRGWFAPVTPGTRFVTVGGMIASAPAVLMRSSSGLRSGLLASTLAV